MNAKMQFKTGPAVLPKLVPKTVNLESIFTQESQLVVPSSQPLLILNLKALFSESAYGDLVSEVGVYLEGDKNKTTFRLSDFDRKVLSEGLKALLILY